MQKNENPAPKQGKFNFLVRIRDLKRELSCLLTEADKLGLQVSVKWHNEQLGHEYDVKQKVVS